jgi:hypothetical protein
MQSAGHDTEGAAPRSPPSNLSQALTNPYGSERGRTATYVLMQQRRDSWGLLPRELNDMIFSTLTAAASDRAGMDTADMDATPVVYETREDLLEAMDTKRRRVLQEVYDARGEADRMAAQLAGVVAKARRGVAQYLHEVGRATVEPTYEPTLPTEVWQLILRFCTLRTILSFAAVCREWRAMLFDVHALRAVLVEWGRRWGVNMYPCLRALDVKNWTLDPDNPKGKWRVRKTRRNMLRLLGASASHVFLAVGAGIERPLIIQDSTPLVVYGDRKGRPTRLDGEVYDAEAVGSVSKLPSWIRRTIISRRRLWKPRDMDLDIDSVVGGAAWPFLLRTETRCLLVVTRRYWTSSPVVLHDVTRRGALVPAWCSVDVLQVLLRAHDDIRAQVPSGAATGHLLGLLRDRVFVWIGGVGCVMVDYTSDPARGGRAPLAPPVVRRVVENTSRPVVLANRTMPYMGCVRASPLPGADAEFVAYHPELDEAPVPFRFDGKAVAAPRLAPAIPRCRGNAARFVTINARGAEFAFPGGLRRMYPYNDSVCRWPLTDGVLTTWCTRPYRLHVAVNGRMVGEGAAKQWVPDASAAADTLSDPVDIRIGHNGHRLFMPCPAGAHDAGGLLGCYRVIPLRVVENLR